MAADKASTPWWDVEPCTVPRVGKSNSNFWLARQRNLTAAYMCHSFSSTPVAPFYTRATVFQVSQCWHVSFLWRLKVTALDCCGSDTLLLPQIHSAPPHVASAPLPHCCHWAKTFFSLNPSAGESIPAPDGKWGQMKTERPSCYSSKILRQSKFCPTMCFWISSTICGWNQLERQCPLRKAPDEPWSKLT